MRKINQILFFPEQKLWLSIPTYGLLLKSLNHCLLNKHLPYVHFPKLSLLSKISTGLSIIHLQNGNKGIGDIRERTLNQIGHSQRCLTFVEDVCSFSL